MTDFKELVCTNCGADLAGSTCDSCQTNYPTIGAIPWLLSPPDQSLLYWRSSFIKTVDSLKVQAQALRDQAEAKSNLELTTKRLRKLSQAKYEQANLLEKLLQDLGVELNGNASLTEGLFPNQDLTSYVDNIHRDWSWGEEENNISIDCLKDILGEKDLSEARVLFLGAGSGRLAYDFHKQFNPHHTIISDINPLLLICAQKIITGEKVKLYDFPIAPIDLSATQILQKLHTKEPIKKGISFVFADALNTPFKKGSIDLVVTPWLIDILPGDPEHLMRSINQILKTDGNWLNFGPLGFTHQETRFHYSKEEVFQGLETSQFKLEKESSSKIPYMQNPNSQHGRVERITCFLAKKINETENKEVAEVLPDWLLNTKSPIPKNQHFDNLKATHSISSQVFDEVNGGNSLEEMAKTLAPKFGLDHEETLASLKRFFKRNLS